MPTPGPGPEPALPGLTPARPDAAPPGLVPYRQPPPHPAATLPPPPTPPAGKSRGFAFLAYEDQRSTVLAVDNLSGARVAGRVVRVEHVDNYKRKRAEVRCAGCLHAWHGGGRQDGGWGGV